MSLEELKSVLYQQGSYLVGVSDNGSIEYSLILEDQRFEISKEIFDILINENLIRLTRNHPVSIWLYNDSNATNVS